MFESLEEHIKHDEALETTRMERWVRVLVALALATLVLGGIYFGVQLLE